MPKCVFCNYTTNKIRKLYEHYIVVHQLSEDDPFLREYLSFLVSKKNNSNFQSFLLCSSCSCVCTSYERLLKHKLRRHAQQQQTGGAIDDINNAIE